MNEKNQTTSDIERLKSDAAETRQRLADDVDALGEKMSPANLKKEAKAAVSDMGRMAVDEVKSVAQDAAHQTQKFSENFTQVVRENPVPALMVGAGLGWLIYRAATRSRSNRSAYQPLEARHLPQRANEAFSEARHKLQGAADEAKHLTRDAAETAQRRAKELGNQAWHQASDAGRKVEHSYQENPLLFGAATIGAGLALGLALPRTRVENQLLGEQRDHFLDQVKETAESKAKEIEKSTSAKTQSYLQRKNGDSSSL